MVKKSRIIFGILFSVAIAVFFISNGIVDNIAPQISGFDFPEIEGDVFTIEQIASDIDRLCLDNCEILTVTDDMIEVDCLEGFCEVLDDVIIEETSQPPPVTSDDDTVTQIEDELEINPTVAFIEVIISRVFTSETGEEDITQETIQISEAFLSFITTKDTFTDLQKHQLNFILDVKTEGRVLEGKAIIKILVDDTFFSLKEYTFTGMPEDGILTFKTNKIGVADLLKDKGTQFSKITINLQSLFIITEEKRYFIEAPRPIYEIVFDKDEHRILADNERGETTKIYPQDDKLLIGNPPHNLTPAIGELTVKDKNGEVIASALANSGGKDGKAIMIDILLERNTSYTITVGNPQNIEFTIDTPKSQKNYSFGCMVVTSSEVRRAGHTWNTFITITPSCSFPDNGAVI